MLQRFCSSACSVDSWIVTSQTKASECDSKKEHSIWQDGCTADNAQKAGTNKTEPYFGTEKMPRSFMDVKSSKELEEALHIEKARG